MADDQAVTSPQSGADKPSVEQRILGLFGEADDPPEQDTPESLETEEQDAPERVEAQQDAEQSDDEPTADDLPEEKEPDSAPGEVEFTYNGRTQKVSLDEARRLASAGMDYTQKTQQLAEDRARLQQAAAQVQQAAALQQALIDDVAALRSIQRQMAAYPQDAAGWAKLSQEDPIGAFQRSTEYQSLRQEAERAAGQIQAKSARFNQATQQVSQEQLATEFAKAVEAVPEWRDVDRYRQDVEQMRGFARSVGYQDEDLNRIDDHRVLKVLKYAAAYDNLLRQKAAKVKEVRKAPPVVKPGVAPRQTSERQERMDELRKVSKNSRLDPTTRAKAVERIMFERMK